MWQTALVSMPFRQADRPSIQLGLLKAIGEARGFPIRTVHANLDFVRRIGMDRYAAIADQPRPLLGDWLFAVAAFGQDAPEERLTDDEDLLRIREQDVPAYLDELVEGFPWHEFRVVGFSSSFQQNVASFALARRLKERYPDLVTVFGGANFDGEMGLELVRSIDCVDYAVIGEGDTAFPALLEAIEAGTDPTLIPGVYSRDGGTPPAQPRDGLDDLPPPDYDEYFSRAAELGLPTNDVWLPFESARGCWWGAKHHCTFCGLNGSTMRFRAKSPSRVLAEFATQSRRYRTFRFEAVDNILDVRYLTEVFPVIATEHHDYQFFYELKANLTRAQVRTLARGGVVQVQPGIESLSSHVLRLMDKGVRAAQNVNLLRWARYYGIGVSWNILWGFPGETEYDYTAQAAAVPHLVHLQPPAGADRVWLERFSPMFSQPDKFPLGPRHPDRSYRMIYPSTVDISRVAYFYDHSPDNALPDSVYATLAKAVDEWAHAWQGATPPSLTYRTSPGYLEIYDARHPERTGTYTFRDTLADIYLACVDRPTTARAVHGKLQLRHPVEAVQEAFHQFADRGLMFLDGDLALSLALPRTPGR
ncbi:ribosomal peptide maturation radical SAM protein 1 [Actinocrispum wychmicini]|uniref:Ribosomal peptide maturation radical SAM protein 1 n=2 Tax=Actinocrispum wychmicini TaxID=1213861 RepID=A0A4R2JU88_9PSEU|nr:ribosomal peptide maturation radical SAM protein 1 [Actinocrispum wychmicini]